MIIDSHLHISYLDEKKKNLFDVKKELLESMKQFGIDYSIVIPDNVPNSKCADTKTMFKIIGDDKQFFSMGTINIFQDIEKQILDLELLVTAKKICAIKLFPGHDPFYPTDEKCQSVYRLCVKHNIPVVFHTGANTGDSDCAKYNDPKYIIEIAEKYKTLKVVISHYFWPEMDYCYQMTKDLKNIYYDTSAMADPEVVEATGGWDKVVQVLKKTVLLKPDNVLFGTDWPMCPVDKHIQLIRDLELDYKTEEKIFFLNAVNLYKFEIL
ncbi:MAG: amidohydrolase family protein [Candidatus Woesebacteria bacterium]|nr:amidohydrolase family protein [Candidatus Woesebacteria bacterium]